MGFFVRRRCSGVPELISGPFHREYRVLQKLGSGNYGCVYAARRTLTDEATGSVADEDFAVKVMDSTPTSGTMRQQLVQAEIAILHALPRVDNIVKFYGVRSEGPLTYVVMEKCDMGLADLLGSLLVNETSVQALLTDMLCGLAACHMCRIVHRDVKPDNFLVSPSGPGGKFVVKLCDFGLSAMLSNPHARELCGNCGTAPFMAPEMLLDWTYGTSVDIWALGTLAYVVLFGKWPYHIAEHTGQAMKNAIMVGQEMPSFQSGGSSPALSAPCTSWVKSLLRRDPVARPSAQRALAHRAFISEWRGEGGDALRPSVERARRAGAFDDKLFSLSRSSAIDATVKALSMRHHGAVPAKAGDDPSGTPLERILLASRGGLFGVVDNDDDLLGPSVRYVRSAPCPCGAHRATLRLAPETGGSLRRRGPRRFWRRARMCFGF